ncbi:MAG: hypothetical protein H7251_12415 [Acetobacteraceae bacterium]|nr:hypothetical protein [Acetobacteraceae bacterium]
MQFLTKCRAQNATAMAGECRCLPNDQIPKRVARTTDDNVVRDTISPAISLWEIAGVRVRNIHVVHKKKTFPDASPLITFA